MRLRASGRAQALIAIAVLCTAVSLQTARAQDAPASNTASWDAVYPPHAEQPPTGPGITEPSFDEQRAPYVPSLTQVYIGAVGMLAAPFGQDDDKKWGGGGGFLFGFRYKPVPLTLGFDFLPAHWGSAKRTFLLDPADPNTRVSLKRGSNSVMFDLWLRLQPAHWRIQPYIEVSAGLKTIQSTYTVGFVRGAGVTQEQKVQSWSSSLGCGAGVDFKIGEASHDAAAYLTFGVRWVHGSKSNFQHLINEGDQDQNLDVNIPTTTTLIMLGILARGDFGDDDGARN